MLKKVKRFSLKFNFYDLVIALASIFLVCIFLIIINIKMNNDKKLEGEKIVHIYYDGKEIMDVNLENVIEEYEVILLEEDYPMIKERMVINFSSKGVCIKEAHCLNKICMHEGYINDASRLIVCLPSGIVIYITTSSSGNSRWA